jgi:hypothetical protein
MDTGDFLILGALAGGIYLFVHNKKGKNNHLTTLLSSNSNTSNPNTLPPLPKDLSCVSSDYGTLMVEHCEPVSTLQVNVVDPKFGDNFFKYGY